MKQELDEYLSKESDVTSYHTEQAFTDGLMAERVRGQYLDRHPAPAEGMERIQAFEQAQMVADELVLHDMVYT